MLTNDNLSTGELKEKICYEVTKLLIVLNFNAAYKGFTYLKESIIYLIKNKKCMINLSKDVYPYIGKKYHVSQPQIEKSIRLAISQASLSHDYNKPDTDTNMFFREVLRSPKNKVFIAAACEAINNRLGSKKYSNFTY